MKKSMILLMYVVALYFVLKRYYGDKTQTHTGLPEPTVLMGPSYLYGVLALASDFLEGLPIVLAAGLTITLIWRSQPTAIEGGSKKVPRTTPAQRQAAQQQKVG